MKAGYFVAFILGAIAMYEYRRYQQAQALGDIANRIGLPPNSPLANDIIRLF